MQAIDIKARMLRALALGATGVKIFNDWQLHLKKIDFNFDQQDFSHQILSKINLEKFHLNGASFEESTLTNANLTGCICRGTNFRKADLSSSLCRGLDAPESNFSQANLKAVVAEGANLRNANLEEADLTAAVLKNACLEGANFLHATMLGVNLEGAKINDSTKLPSGFVPDLSVVWTGTGPDPRKAAADPKLSENDVVDFDSLIKELWGRFETYGLERARGMLQAEKFHLFADVGADFVVGVARSQSKPEDRVYACVLREDGSYGCCTQNLSKGRCGAMRGAACKHIFLLLFVLCKTGKFEPALAFRWLMNSKDKKDSIDKELMSKTFLRYMGAQEGEIDWRPIETIPEDYYM
jgi:hypothetical protein